MIDYMISYKNLKELQSGFWKDFFEYVVEDDLLDGMSEQLGQKVVFAVMKKFEDDKKKILAIDANRHWYLFVEDKNFQ